MVVMTEIRNIQGDSPRNKIFMEYSLNILSIAQQIKYYPYRYALMAVQVSEQLQFLEHFFH